MDNKKIPEDDLTWLARNVDIWKSGYEFAVVEVCDGGFYVRWPSICSGGITKGQWLARRAELQNKPSWADAPEWANWLGQTESGEWEWYGDDRNFPPTAGDLYWHHDGDSHPALGVGLVLGNWRDTLERRPDMNKSEPKIDTSAERVQKTEESMHVTAASMLTAALGHMEDRAKTYDAPGGERSMGKTVSAFNTITGLELTEEQGWLFMEILKQVRSQRGNYRADNYEDMVAYAALRGECAARERGNKS